MDRVSSAVIELIDACLAGGLSMEAIGDRVSILEGLDLTGIDDPLRSTLENAMHFLRHYQADDDIRAKDKGYADFQEAELKEFRRLLAA